jgi:hypothetical protein
VILRLHKIIYSLQQPFIDTYSKVTDAKLYTEKSAIMAANMLNSRGIPFFNEQEIPLAF